MKNDKYSKARGGWSRILDVTCNECGSRICYYQKDGPGSLKRMYVDRMIGMKSSNSKLTCSGCGHELGIQVMYEKENRPAYRLFQGSVNKRIIKQVAVK